MRPKTSSALVLLCALVIGPGGDDVAADPPANARSFLTVPGLEPGARRSGPALLGNDVLEVRWPADAGQPGPLRVTNLLRNTTIELGSERFVLDLGDGGLVRASDLDLQAGWQAKDGRLTARYLDPKRRFGVTFEARLDEGAHYVRTRVDLQALDEALVVREIRLFEVPVPGARRVGSVSGSVVTVDEAGLFLAAEHPMAENDAGYDLTRVGTWSPEDVTWPQASTMRWNVTNAVTRAGRLEVLFQYTKGGHRLEIHGAKLLQGDEVVAEDGHFGATGTRDVENRFRFHLEEHDPDADYTLEIQGLSDGGTDSNGWVGLARVDGPPRVLCTLKTETELAPGQATSLGAVIGVFPGGQLRRSFLRYLEHERAHPYRTFLHYNSWYDVGYFSTYDEAACLDVVKTYGEELVTKRGATMDSFLFDDGWDDTASLWDFHDGLPNGFVRVKELAATYDSAPGVWLSPWGGYGEPRQQRLAAGEEAGYETTSSGFVLSAPKYYARFRDICLDMIRTHGANHFKFDGVGRSGERYPGSAFGSDFEAAIALIDTLRTERPDVYINQTTGTWPSPFWLLFADSIWRGGYDHEFLGVGSKRQQWITYRDAMTYENVVRGGPLFPLSSLMLHGVIYAQHARGLKDDPQGDLQDEIRSAFGCGTQLQELYVTPSLLTKENWDDLAAAARWARKRAGTLQDTHWVGGSPKSLEVYGWAAWSPLEGTLTLRNPKGEKQSFEVDPELLFETRPGRREPWLLESPYADQRVQHLSFVATKARTIELEPFEVLVFDARPAK